MLARVVNNDAPCPIDRGAWTFFASVLAPTDSAAFLNER